MNCFKLLVPTLVLILGAIAPGVTGKAHAAGCTDYYFNAVPDRTPIVNGLTNLGRSLMGLDPKQDQYQYLEIKQIDGTRVVLMLNNNGQILDCFYYNQ